MRIKHFFKTDFLSSIVVFLIALPLCLGIALASGAPLLSGVIAGIIGGIVVGWLSGSPLSVSGPAAGLTSIVVSSIHDLGSFQLFLLSLVLAGILQLLLGFLKAGAIGHFFPAAVIKGMLASIGLILILKQIPHAVGFDADFEGDESFFQPDGRNTFSEIFAAFEHLSLGAIVVSILSVLILVFWDQPKVKTNKFLAQLPAPLIVVLFSVLVNFLFKVYIPDLQIMEKHLVTLPSLSYAEISSSFSFPDFLQWANVKVYIIAITIAVVASLETLLNIEACDKLDPFKRVTHLNRELKAQGAGNLLSGLAGGLPITSVIVRSSANIQAGARTKASAIAHGILLLSAVVLIPNVLQLIPLPALAGILIVVGFKLIKPSLFKEMYAKGWSQFLPFVVTVIAVIATDLLQGVFAGILVSVFFILKTNFHESVIMVTDHGSYLLVLTKDVSFLNKSTLRKKFHQIPGDSKVLIDGSQAVFIDNDIKEAIQDFIDYSKIKNISVETKNIKL